MERVLGWRWEQRGGEKRLTMIRIREHVTEPDGLWGEKQITQVRVIYASTDKKPGRVEIYRGGGPKGEDWKRPVKVLDAITSFDEIPIHTMYANQTGFMTAAPPLLDMAYNNVAHWQAASDLAHIVHVSNFPILYLAGDLRGQGDTDEEPIVDEGDESSMGPNMLVQGKVGTELKFVEHTGAAIEAGERHIEKLEEHMALQGIDLLTPRVGGPETATGRIIDFAESISDLESMAQSMTSVGNEALRKMIDVSNVTYEPPEGEELMTIGTNLSLSVKDATDLEAIKFARQNRDISRKQYIRELKRRRTLEQDYDPEEDEAELQDESPFAGDGVTMSFGGNQLVEEG
jgi:hypothetical protein